MQNTCVLSRCGLACTGQKTGEFLMVMLSEELAVSLRRTMGAAKQNMRKRLGRKAPGANIELSPERLIATDFKKDALPPDETAGTLRYFRACACRAAQPNTIECAKWSQTDPTTGSPAPGEPTETGPFLKTASFVCRRPTCNKPIVEAEEFIEQLGWSRLNENFNDRTLRRFINSEEKMRADYFKCAVSNAMARGWISALQGLSMFNQLLEVQVSGRSLRAVFGRASERKSYMDFNEWDISQDEVSAELARQLHIRNVELNKVLDQHLNGGNLPDDMARLVKDVLYDDIRPR